MPETLLLPKKVPCKLFAQRARLQTARSLHRRHAAKWREGAEPPFNPQVPGSRIIHRTLVLPRRGARATFSSELGGGRVIIGAQFGPKSESEPWKRAMVRRISTLPGVFDRCDCRQHRPRGHRLQAALRPEPAGVDTTHLLQRTSSVLGRGALSLPRRCPRCGTCDNRRFPRSWLDSQASIRERGCEAIVSRRTRPRRSFRTAREDPTGPQRGRHLTSSAPPPWSHAFARARHRTERVVFGTPLTADPAPKGLRGNPRSARGGSGARTVDRRRSRPRAVRGESATPEGESPTISPSARARPYARHPLERPLRRLPGDVDRTSPISTSPSCRPCTPIRASRGNRVDGHGKAVIAFRRAARATCGGRDHRTPRPSSPPDVDELPRR